MDTVKPRKRRKRQESIFTTDFGKSWKAQGGYWYKIPDVGGALARFAPPRPYDILASFNRTPMVIEIKHCKSVLFSLSEMREHQIPELSAAQSAGFAAFVLVVYDKLQNRVADMFHLESLVRAEREGRKQIRPEEAAVRFYSPRQSKWEINSLMIERAISTAPKFVDILFEVV